MNFLKLWSLAQRYFTQTLAVDPTMETDAYGEPLLAQFKHSLPSTDPDQSLVICGELSDRSAYDQYTLHLYISDARHPHDPHFETGMIGDENKNPVFVPALHLMRQHVPAAIANIMKNVGIPAKATGSPIFRNDSNGINLFLRFNPKDGSGVPSNAELVSSRKIGRLFNQLKQSMADLLPALQKSIDDHAHLHVSGKDEIGILGHIANLKGRVVEMHMRGSGGMAPATTDPDEAGDWANLAMNKGLDGARIAERGPDGVVRVFEATRLES